jgi:hypothetical protein
LVLAEVAGDLRNLDGQFDVSSPILFTHFWRQYFTERGRHAAWPPAISVSDISQVLAYLYDTKRLMLFQDTIHLWRAQASWQNFCDWIASAPVSSLGSGLTQAARRRLSARMHVWLEELGVAEHEEVSLEWGIKISLIMKKKS